MKKNILAGRRAPGGNFLTAFTLTELVIVMVLITLIVCVTLPLTKKKMDKVEYFAYYMGYKTVQDISANIVSQVNISSYNQNRTLYSIALFWKNKFNELKANFINSNAAYSSTAILYRECIIYSMSSTCVEYLFENITESLCAHRTDEYNMNNNTCNYAYNLSEEFTVGDSDGDETIVDDDSGNEETGDDDETAAGDESQTNWKLCERIASMYNIKSANCSMQLTSSVLSSGDFSSITDPHIILSNGLRLYILSDTPSEITDLNDSLDDDDKRGFTIYVDVNGTSGKSKLWEDVFPFYILLSGKVVPAYNPALNAGANNKEHLSINVVYDNYDGDKRNVKRLITDVNFRQAACTTGYVTSSKYCDGRIQYDICKENEHDCRFQVKTPVKIF